MSVESCDCGCSVPIETMLSRVISESLMLLAIGSPLSALLNIVLGIVRLKRSGRQNARTHARCTSITERVIASLGFRTLFGVASTARFAHFALGIAAREQCSRIISFSIENNFWLVRNIR